MVNDQGGHRAARAAKKLIVKLHQVIVEEIEKRDRVLQDKLDEVQSARNRCCSW